MWVIYILSSLFNYTLLYLNRLPTTACLAVMLVFVQAIVVRVVDNVLIKNQCDKKDRRLLKIILTYVARKYVIVPNGLNNTS